ncbi:MAG: response regulator [Planctomycetia bacterium]|jgi:response regulator RpfG family c-di-GMP phosphodiesterase
MTERILCVDDDPNVLQAYQRALRKRFHFELALGGEEGLEAVRKQGPYAVIVADMQMPVMNGVQFLSRVKDIAPDTVRMMLTGNADQQTALEAVNAGRIFRFMTKPCPPDEFAGALDAGIAQYRLVVAERELLSKTLSGAIKMLTEVLSLTSPTAFGRASRIRQLAHQILEQLEIKNAWQIEIAAMLSQVGCVALPEETLSKVQKGEPLSQTESEDYKAHPFVARELIGNIPRLDQVADIIAWQDQKYEGDSDEDQQGEHKHRDDIPLGSRILKVASDFDILTSTGSTPEQALAEITDRSGWYDRTIVKALRQVLQVTEVHVIRQVKVSQLIDGATIAADVESIGGTLLCARGQEVTPSLRARLKTYLSNIGIKGKIKIFVPEEMADKFEKPYAMSEED